MAVKIIHNRDICIGCGACAANCPDNWEMADDGKSKCKNKSPDEAGCNKKAAESCPVKCIKVVEE